MIKHIVLFSIKEKAEGRTKEENIEIIKDMLESLPDKIALIKEFEVGININEKPNSYDLALVSTFDTMDKLLAYAKHPDHVEVVAFINKVQKNRVAVDYEI